MGRLDEEHILCTDEHEYKDDQEQAGGVRLRVQIQVGCGRPRSTGSCCGHRPFLRGGWGSSWDRCGRWLDYEFSAAHAAAGLTRMAAVGGRISHRRGKVVCSACLRVAARVAGVAGLKAGKVGLARVPRSSVSAGEAKLFAEFGT